MSVIAEVAVSGTAYSFDMLFSYAVPERFSVKCGCRVLVPFGKGNSHRIGAIMKISSGSVSGLKKIISVIDDSPVLSEEMIGLVHYLHDNTFCTYYDAVRTMIPPAMNVKVIEKFYINESFVLGSTLDEDAKELLEKLKQISDNRQLNGYITDFISENGRKTIDELCESGALNTDNIFRQKVGDAVLKMVRLTDSYINSPEKFRLTPKQKAVVEFLTENSASSKETAYMCGVTEIVISNLVRNGVAEEYETEVFRHVEDFSETHADVNDTVLSDEQQNVYNAVYEQVQSQKPAVYLLHGVTGSGKTSVFEKLISGTVGIGRQVLMLIPEISLTPQILKRFRSLFGERVAVIHSGLSMGQRLDEYKRIKSGMADIVIGTRSAVFAPLDNIGLIIMDEEGENTYKSEMPPRYKAHDVAKRRCAYHNATLLLASATPSMESYYLAEKNIYRLVKMKKRYQNMPLPEVSIVDMTEERALGNMAEFSKKLVDEIEANLHSGEQTILLLNRRGYHTIISCMKCRQPVYCPNCSVPLTYHNKNHKLMCHYCGYSSEMVSACPNCGSEKLRNMGFGTQKLEDELNMYFPEARVLRMDADTTFSRYSYEKGFNDFRSGRYDIMIGTQMIGKGLDFPNVTLVGVLSIDKSLYAGDFRSYERTFSLITQVVGRSGRGERSGRAVLQTFIPEHYIINLAAAQDYENFYREEIALRRTMTFPPICDICVFCFSGNDDVSVKKGAYAFFGLMRSTLDGLQPKTPVNVIAPIKSSYGKINGRYRWRIIMKCKNTSEIRDFISGMLRNSAKLKEMNKISVYADMNGDTGF
ncbi:MAG: primosomal protein N' [Ruminococcus sp.]|nr:primosomal protein N' [Ruminococcus sp.]